MKTWAAIRTAGVVTAAGVVMIIGAGAAGATTPSAPTTGGQSLVAGPATQNAVESATMPLKFFHNGLFTATCPSGLVPDRNSVTASGDDIHIDEADYGSNAITITGSTANVHLTNMGFDTHHASFYAECVASS